jgi:hypothetical protein
MEQELYIRHNFWCDDAKVAKNNARNSAIIGFDEMELQFH